MCLYLLELFRFLATLMSSFHCLSRRIPFQIYFFHAITQPFNIFKSITFALIAIGLDYALDGVSVRNCTVSIISPLSNAGNADERTQIIFLLSLVQSDYQPVSWPFIGRQ